MSQDKHEPDYYEILQVHPKASLAVIKKAYRTLLLEMGHHPDQGGSAEMTARITEAYRVLSDTERRAAYDRRYFGRLSQDKEPEAPKAERAAEKDAAASGLVVLCPRCRTKNRVRSQELLSIAKCSRCGQSLARMPNALSDLKEHLLAMWPKRAPGAKPLPKLMRVGIPLVILATSMVAAGYALTDMMWVAGDPLEKTEALKKEGKLDQAAMLLQKALDREPGNARLHEKLGDVYNKQLLHEQALGEYERAIKLNPQNSYLYTLRGNTFLMLNQLPEAELSYKQALKLDPSQSPALVALGNVYAKQERFKEAAALYQRALGQSANADILYNLGMVHQWDGNPSQASKAFSQALVMDPNHRSSMVSLASLYYEQGKYDQAAAQLIKASYLKHSDLDLHLRLADIYERTGRTDQAIKEWQVCLEQGKDNPAVVERARRALQKLGVTTG